MKKSIKLINILRNVIEIYISIFAFTVMFLTFIIGIIARYIFNHPLTWTYEVSVIGFSWAVILGACYAMKTDSHVKFTLIYDRLSRKKGAVLRLIGNLLIFVAFILLIVPSAKYVAFMDFQSTAVFHIKLSWIFAPFVYFLISIIIYTFNQLMEDVRILISSKDDSNLKEIQGKKEI